MQCVLCDKNFHTFDFLLNEKKYQTMVDISHEKMRRITDRSLSSIHLLYMHVGFFGHFNSDNGILLHWDSWIIRKEKKSFFCILVWFCIYSDYEVLKQYLESLVLHCCSIVVHRVVICTNYACSIYHFSPWDNSLWYKYFDLKGNMESLKKLLRQYKSEISDDYTMLCIQTRLIRIEIDNQVTLLQ